MKEWEVNVSIKAKETSRCPDDDLVCRHALTAISGIIVEVGKHVPSSLKVGDCVCGALPATVTSQHDPRAPFLAIGQHYVAPKPESVTHSDGALAVLEALHAYTALIYQGNITEGVTVMVLSAGNNRTSHIVVTAVQMAKHWGAQVLLTCNSAEEKIIYEKAAPDLLVELFDRPLEELSGGRGYLYRECMEETGGLGVDVIIDFGVGAVMVNDDDSDTPVSWSPSKRHVINCLAVRGRWVTSQHRLQLDPPDAELLMRKCAGLHFLYPSVWVDVPTRLGVYQHIIRDALEKTASNKVVTSNS